MWLTGYETLDDARHGIGGHVDRYQHRPHSGLNDRKPLGARRTWEDQRNIAASPVNTNGEQVTTTRKRPDGAAPESNRPSVGLPHRTGFEDLLGHRARAAPGLSVPVGCGTISSWRTSA